MKTLSSRPLALAVAVLCLVGLACAAPEPIPDTEIGLSKASVFDVPTPEPVADALPEPGDAAPIARAFPGAPPEIPHAVTDLLPITRDENLCVDCHFVDPEDADGMPAIPRDHLIDWRNAPGEVRDEVAGARWVCTSCHVAPTGAEPLVAMR